MGLVKQIAERHYGLLQVAVVVAGIETYELLRHAMTPDWQVALGHAQKVVSWEQFAHIEWEEGLQQTFLRVPELVRAMNVFYFVGHFRAHERLLLLAVPPFAARVPPLP